MSLAKPHKDIEISPDGSNATINHLAAEDIFGEKVSTESVVSILAANGITNHIDTLAIEIAVENSNKTGKPIENLIAARARINHEISFLDINGLSVRDLIQEIDYARKTEIAINNYNPEAKTDFKARFVTEETIICSIKEADKEDILGRKLKKQTIPVKLKAGTNVEVNESFNGITFIAKQTGYLVVDSQMRVNIVSPFKYANDRMTIHFIILPLKHAESYKELLNYYASKFQDIVIKDQACCDLFTITERVMKAETEGGLIDHIIIAKGMRPIPGKSAEIKICVDTERDKHDGETSIIDYMKKAHYTMVNKGDLLAEITLSIDGIAGIDVYGNAVDADQVKAQDIKIGENIRVEENDETAILYAKKDGCLIYNSNSISVSDILYINGDVGPETGNISQGSSVFITGNILNGFSVECKGDLIVNGSIENNVTVKCGSLVVKKGVFTKKGFVYVKHNADIGYIQEGKIRVSGDMTIQRYVYGAKIYCRGNLYVLGRGVSGSQRGAVMGSSISVLGCAVLDSVGNLNENTAIMCGSDQEMSYQIENSKMVISKLQSEVITLQKSINVDFSSTNVVEIISKLSAKQKKDIEAKLIEIKKVLTLIDSYKEKIEKLKEKAYAQELDNISIKIQRFIIPKTTFAIGNIVTNVNNILPGMTARLKGKELKLYPNR